MNNILVKLNNITNTKSILLITEDLAYINCIRDSNIRYDLINFDRKKIKLLLNIIFDYHVIIFDNKNNTLTEFVRIFRIGYLNNFNIPIIVLDDELSLDLANTKFLNIFTVLPRDINNKRSLLNIELCFNHFKSNKKIILKDGFYFDIRSGIFSRNKNIIELTSIERKLIKLLIENINMLVSYETIKEIVWKNKKYSIYGLRNVVKRIRQKTEEIFIKNSSNNGYMIEGI